MHDSPAVRETVGILLGAEYEVQAAGVDEYLSQGIHAAAPQLLIAPASLARHALPASPVLWVEDGRGAALPGPSLSPQFSPRELRQQVGAALARPLPSPRPGARSRLEPPFVPAETALTLAEATRSQLPLHLVGEPGTGKRALARAVHAAHTEGELAWVDAAELESGLGGLTRHVGTVFVDRVETLAPAAQQRLLAGLDATGQLRRPDGGSARLISAAVGDLAAATEAGRFAPALYYQLTLLTAPLPPLRERSHDIAPLARQLAADLAAALGRAPATLTARALERLTNYLWFGNLAELEAVLARSLALTRATSLDAADLLFDGARPRPLPRPGASAATATPTAPRPLAAEPLDLIINELAHEFKNPLVTLKTFAHHLRRAPAPGDDDAQVARLTGEAVEQIDQTLENLLEFTRLEAPAPQTLPLATLLDPVLQDCRYALGARGLRLEHDALPAVAVSGDPQQLGYALGNLVRALARDLPSGAELRVGFQPPAALTIQLPDGADPLGNHLATLLDRSNDPTQAPPLGVAIAHTVLSRNGAELNVAGEGSATVVVRFRRADAEHPTKVLVNGSAPRSDR
ncbi:MAG: sigma 54-interacting transcriptional regulator [Deltaproteobacteria bacterium]|nr:sigma 54-interacting transcriptional regulator [Deltaproteobacteria bacterium]